MIPKVSRTKMYLPIYLKSIDSVFRLTFLPQLGIQVESMNKQITSQQNVFKEIGDRILQCYALSIYLRALRRSNAFDIHIICLGGKWEQRQSAICNLSNGKIIPVILYLDFLILPLLPTSPSAISLSLFLSLPNSHSLTFYRFNT